MFYISSWKKGQIFREIREKVSKLYNWNSFGVSRLGFCDCPLGSTFSIRSWAMLQITGGLQSGNSVKNFVTMYRLNRQISSILLQYPTYIWGVLRNIKMSLGSSSFWIVNLKPLLNVENTIYELIDQKLHILNYLLKPCHCISQEGLSHTRP